ncbi:MAG: C40 family peptidase [Flavobacteriaceae bacterium]|nr:C40 family peptidase [Flavobacteriaceae bacterium]
MRSQILLILLAIVFFSCGSSRKTVSSKKSNEIEYNVPADITPKVKAIIENAKEYEGVRYKYGGDNKKGIDCSGLVMNAYDKENIKLPRSTSQLASSGDWVDLKQVRPGDLMFFATRKNSRKVNHVAIVTEARPGYIEFIHSTTSRGVITSTLDEKYWYFAFVQARRVL